MTELGPTLTARDLAARKTLALFGRAEARDFTDVYWLSRRFGKDQLLRLAGAQDQGCAKVARRGDRLL
uniref:nucleotidyl transferase AbiEii/AbiGii toxin family protein n=1 Tax=Protofrankia symbiont of Coriaria ruscifolia TaxID=1306542 RepID=UPI0013EFA229